MRRIRIAAIAALVAMALVATAAMAAGEITGKVAETMNSGGYTYILLKSGAEETWVAIPEAKVTVGETVTVQPGMPMQNFTSKSLKRTFKTIVFSGGLVK